MTGLDEQSYMERFILVWARQSNSSESNSDESDANSAFCSILHQMRRRPGCATPTPVQGFSALGRKSLHVASVQRLVGKRSSSYKHNLRVVVYVYTSQQCLPWQRTRNGTNQNNVHSDDAALVNHSATCSLGKRFWIQQISAEWPTKR